MSSRNGIYELREDITALADYKDSRNKQNVVKVAFWRLFSGKIWKKNYNIEEIEKLFSMEIGRCVLS